MDYILLLGSSFIKRMKKNLLKKNKYLTEKYKILNYGISRQRTDMILDKKYINKLMKISPLYQIENKNKIKYIIFYCGNTDLVHTIDKIEVYKNIIKMIDMLNTLFPESKVLILSILKSPRNKLYNLYKDIDYINNHLYNMYKSSSNNIYININRQIRNHYDLDNIHLNEEGYNKLYDCILQFIK